MATWAITRAQNNHHILQCFLKKRLYFSLFVKLLDLFQLGRQRQDRTITIPTIPLSTPRMMMTGSTIVLLIQHLLDHVITLYNYFSISSLGMFIRLAIAFTISPDYLVCSTGNGYIVVITGDQWPLKFYSGELSILLSTRSKDIISTTKIRVRRMWAEISTAIWIHYFNVVALNESKNHVSLFHFGSWLQRYGYPTICPGSHTDIYILFITPPVYCIVAISIWSWVFAWHYNSIRWPFLVRCHDCTWCIRCRWGRAA